MGVHLDSIFAKIKRLNGQPIYEALGGLFNPDSGLYPVFLIEPEDLVGETGTETYTTAAQSCCSFLTEVEGKSDTVSVAVVINKDFASFEGNKWMPRATSFFVDNTDALIFATESEAEQVANFFLKRRFATEDVGQALKMQLRGNPTLPCFQSFAEQQFCLLSGQLSLNLVSIIRAYRILPYIPDQIEKTGPKDS